MIALENQVTSLALSLRLKELGVKQESYFWWGQSEIDDEPLVYHDCLNRALREPTYSAFTVAELGEMLTKSGHGSMPAYSDQQNDTGWYRHVQGDVVVADTEADARAKMLIYLIENKLITV